MLTQHLRALGHEVEGAENGVQALAMIAEKSYDLVLLDLNMPEMDGHSVLRRLHDQSVSRELPIIVISSEGEVATVARCIEAGAEDYLTRPYDLTLLQARVLNCLEKKRWRDREVAYTEELVRLRAQLEEHVRELERVNRTLESLAFTDSLTGLPNRRFARQSLAQMWELFKRTARPFSLILADVDHFKRLNDTQGHDFGDRVLIRLADLFRSTARGADLVCRLGGEEFLVLCPDTDLEGALLLAERLRAALEDYRFDPPVPVTASFGAAEAASDLPHEEALLKAADEALYSAKERGRNRVAAHHSLSK